MLKVIVIIILIVIAVVFILSRRQGRAVSGWSGRSDFDYMPPMTGKPICPYCGISNEVGAVFCGNCGGELGTSARPEAAACPRCGAPMESDDMYCANCGYTVDFTGKTVVTGVELCNHCGAPVESDQDYCMNCGAPLRPIRSKQDDDDDVTVLIDVEDDGNVACLQYFENGLARRIHLHHGITRIGSKDRNNNYVLPSRKVSKEHAEVIKEGTRYFIKDLNSTNGTYLNGSTERMEADRKVEIHNGDRIRMADIELVLKC